MSWDAATPAGLVAILENPKWPVSKACQAVEDCILANRCAWLCSRPSLGCFLVIFTSLRPFQPLYKAIDSCVLPKVPMAHYRGFRCEPPPPAASGR